MAYLGPNELDDVYKLNRKGYLDYREQESVVIPAIKKYSISSELLSRESKLELVKGSKKAQKGREKKDRTLTEQITEELQQIPENKEQEEEGTTDT